MKRSREEHDSTQQSLDDIETPALCVDLDRWDRNVSRFATLCADHGREWRPHMKGHKSGALAKKLVDAGYAIGATCAKLGEAEVMAAAGLKDILIANQIVGASKMKRLVALRRSGADVVVTVDNEHHVQELASAATAAGLSPDMKIRVIIEVNIGMDRAGVAPLTSSEGPCAVLARKIAAHTGVLRFAGLMGYEGHLLMIQDADEKRTKIEASVGQLVATAHHLDTAGFPCPIVSCGGTGSIDTTVTIDGVSEIQASGGKHTPLGIVYSCLV